MIKIRIIFLTLISLLFTSCVSDPDGYLKRSGNRKLVSGKNLYSKKRMPIQNKQYIKKAKRNIVENNYDDDYEDDDYDQDPRLTNRRLYMQMVAQEQEKKRQNYRRDQDLRDLELEEREKQANQKIIHSNQESHKAQKELQIELQNIKSILTETREQMSSMTCMTKAKQSDLEITSIPSKSQDTAKPLSKEESVKKSNPVSSTAKNPASEGDKQNKVDEVKNIELPTSPVKKSDNKKPSETLQKSVDTNAKT
jgi:hypothetical protein